MATGDDVVMGTLLQPSGMSRRVVGAAAGGAIGSAIAWKPEKKDTSIDRFADAFG